MMPDNVFLTRNPVQNLVMHASCFNKENCSYVYIDTLISSSNLRPMAICCPNHQALHNCIHAICSLYIKMRLETRITALGKTLRDVFSVLFWSA